MVATRNQGKLRELKAMLEPLGWTVYSLRDFPHLPEVVENGTTFTENAVKKARTIAVATGMVALADDSGLEVDVLNGAPGVYSARFAGEHGNDAANNAKLLRLLNGLPLDKRRARFRCVIAIALPTGEVFTAEGTCEGYIAFQPRGENGFGYDPLFYLPEYNLTFAEMPASLKNKISHRARAMALARDILAGLANNQEGKD